MAQHWIKGGSKIKHGGIIAIKMMRLLRIDIKIKVRMLNKDKSHSILLVTSSHPTSSYKKEELEEYNQKLTDFLGDILSSNNHHRNRP